MMRLRSIKWKANASDTLRRHVHSSIARKGGIHVWDVTRSRFVIRWGRT